MRFARATTSTTEPPPPSFRHARCVSTQWRPARGSRHRVVDVGGEEAHVTRPELLRFATDFHSRTALQDVVGLLDTRVPVRQGSAASLGPAHNAKDNFELARPDSLARDELLVDSPFV